MIKHKVILTIVKDMEKDERLVSLKKFVSMAYKEYRAKGYEPVFYVLVGNVDLLCKVEGALYELWGDRWKYRFWIVLDFSLEEDVVRTGVDLIGDYLV